MAIVKVTRSGKAITFWDDFGNGYQTSVAYLLAHISGKQKSPFVPLTRYPVPNTVDRFEPSPVYGKDFEKIPHSDPRWSPPQCPHKLSVSRAEDSGIDKRQLEKRDVEDAFRDVVDW